MMDSDDRLAQKLETVLNSFLLKDFCNWNNEHFEMLVNHLSKKEHCGLLQTNVVLDWIDQCVNILLDDFNGLHQSVVSFMFKLCATVTENEWLIIGLREKNTLERLM